MRTCKKRKTKAFGIGAALQNGTENKRSCRRSFFRDPFQSVMQPIPNTTSTALPDQVGMADGKSVAQGVGDVKRRQNCSFLVFYQKYDEKITNENKMEESVVTLTYIRREAWTKCGKMREKHGFSLKKTAETVDNPGIRWYDVVVGLHPRASALF